MFQQGSGQTGIRPLAGVRVLEVGGMGPTPFAGMVLGDLGAEVVRVDKPGGLGVFPGPATADVGNRGKRSVGLDVKHPDGLAALLALAARADVLVEGNRPGVAERLGFGPAVVQAANPGLVYGRMTGWGQEGPLAQRAGHDISYIALTGALHLVGPASTPSIPGNLVGDYGGGAMYLVAGVLAALLERERTGRGRVVDAAIVDGVLHLLGGMHGLLNAGAWVDRREANVFDGIAPFYSVYAASDGGHVAVGAIEPKFYAALLDGLGLAEEVEVANQQDRATWPATRARIAAVFRTRTRDEWTEVFADTDACVSPVLGLLEAGEHPHVRARGSLLDDDGFLQPAPAPRFDGVRTEPGGRPPEEGADTLAVLAEVGVDGAALVASGAAFTA